MNARAGKASPSRRRFVREHTAVAIVPFVPEIRLFTASEVTSLWRVTETWLDARGLDVPFWAVPWAGGQVLARWVLDHRDAVRGLRVLDFGTGGGLVAIAAAIAGARDVRAVDIDPLACAAAELNAETNAVTIHVECIDAAGTDVDADVLLAGDIWYDRAAALRFGPWLAAQAARGVRVVTGDPGRAYVPSAALELAVHDVPTSIELESVASLRSRVLELPPRQP
jgi:predicted nicotinamide N-methyase